MLYAGSKPTTVTLRGRGPVIPLIAIMILTVMMPTRSMPPTQLPASSGARQALGNLPLAFEPNVGQAASAVKMLVKALGGTVAFTERALLLQLPAADRHGAQAVELEFLNSNPQAAIEPEARFAATGNYYLGNDPAHWHAQVPLYAGMRYQELYKGIDLRYGGEGGHLKGTYVVQAQADPALIHWRYRGADAVQIEAASGNLEITVQNKRRLEEQRPTAWQDINGRRVPVEARFDLRGDQVGFTLGAYDHARALTIDPTLVYGTYLGGTGADYARGIAVDGQGWVYVVGDTFSNDFLGANTPLAGGKDVMVLKFHPGTQEPATFDIIGGSGYDEGLAITTTTTGDAYITVDPDSSDFPLKNAVIPALPDAGDGILIKLTPSLDIASSTYVGFGMSNLENTHNITLDPQGNVVVVGDAYDAYTTSRALAVKKFSSTIATILLDKHVGAVMPGTAVAVDRQGTIYVTGTESDDHGTDLPVTPNAMQKVCGRQQELGPDVGCGEDAYVLVMSASGNVTYASYLGGASADYGTGIAVDKDGNIWVTGNTFSPHFPTTAGALQPTCPVDAATNSCYYHTFVSKLTPDGAHFVFSTFLGGTDKDGQEFAAGVVVDGAGNGYVAGFTNSKQFPVKDAPQPGLQPGICLGISERRCFDAYLTAFTPSGSLIYSTYLGGSLDEYTGGLALDTGGTAYITGHTAANNFPVTGDAFQGSKSANDDIFVASVGTSATGGGQTIQTFIPLAIR